MSRPLSFLTGTTLEDNTSRLVRLAAMPMSTANDKGLTNEELMLDEDELMEDENGKEGEYDDDDDCGLDELNFEDPRRYQRY